MRCEEVRRSEGSLCVRASNSSRSALSFCKPCDGLGTPCAARLLATSSAHATRHRVHTTNATCIGVLQDGCCMLPCCQQGSMPVRRAGGYATCTCTCNMHMCMHMCMCMCHVHVHAHVCIRRERTVGHRHRHVTVHQLHAACIQHEPDDPRILDHPLVVDAIEDLHTHRLRLRGAPSLAHAERALIYCTWSGGRGRVVGEQGQGQSQGQGQGQGTCKGWCQA